MRRLTLLLGAILLAGLFLVASLQSLGRAQAPVEDTLVCFRRGVDVYCVERSLSSDGGVMQRLQAALEALVAGPTPEEQAAGIWSAIPGGASLVQINVERSRVRVYLDLPEEFLTQEFNPLLSDQMVEQIVKTTQPFRAEIMVAAGIPVGLPTTASSSTSWPRIPPLRMVPSVTSLLS